MNKEKMEIKIMKIMYLENTKSCITYYRYYRPWGCFFGTENEQLVVQFNTPHFQLHKLTKIIISLI